MPPVPMAFPASRARDWPRATADTEKVTPSPECQDAEDRTQDFFDVGPDGGLDRLRKTPTLRAAAMQAAHKALISTFERRCRL